MEEKRIDAKILRDYINSRESEITDTWTPGNFEITVRHTLPLRDVLTFVNEVVSTCFDEESGEYLPEVKDFIIKKNILEMYANFDLPKNAEECYSLIYGSGVVNYVLGYVNTDQFNEIMASIDEKLNHFVQTNIEMVHKQLNELYMSFDTIMTQMEAIFSGVNAEDMKKLVGALSNFKLDEEKLVKAYMGSKGKVVQMPETEK